jgi:signal transduction histidine kinase
MEQVITNLMTNAFRYGEDRPVTLRVEKRGETALISVRDHGIGLAPEMRERIFNRFERAGSNYQISGLGLGLFITQQIVSAHGGRIWVESPGLEKGATFFVELPLSDSSMGHA